LGGIAPKTVSVIFFAAHADIAAYSARLEALPLFQEIMRPFVPPAEEIIQYFVARRG